MSGRGEWRTGRFFRLGAAVLALALFTAWGDVEAAAPGGKGVIEGWYSFLGTWTVSTKWGVAPTTTSVLYFSPSGLVYEDRIVSAVWSQAGNYMNWQYEDGTLFQGKMLSNYAMTGTMSAEDLSAGTWTASRTYAPGVFSFLNASNSAAEGTTKAIYVYRTRGDDGVVSVNYSVVPLSATAWQDYTPKSGTLTWQNGDDASKKITIPVLADGQAEGIETFAIVLKKPVNGYLGSPSKTTVYILPGKAGTVVNDP